MLFDGSQGQVKSFIYITVSSSFDLRLIFEKSSMKNQIGQTWFFVYFKLDFYCKIQVQIRQKIKFSQLDFSNSIFQKSITDQ